MPKNYTNSILLVDFSYLVFHKFFSLRIWYNKAYPDNNHPDDYDWLSDTIFIEKYKKLFFTKILNICKKRHIDPKNIIFSIDSKCSNLWRTQLDSSYKATRKESHKKSKFYCYNIFKLAIDELLPVFNEKYGSRVIKVEGCEADDIIAQIAIYLNSNNEQNSNYDNNNQMLDNNNLSNNIELNQSKNKYIFIVANDSDYIQICSDKIFLIDVNNNNLNNKYLSLTFNNSHYLLSKILAGDTSDNINTCYINTKFLNDNGINHKFKFEYIKCSKKLAISIVNNIQTYIYFWNLINQGRDNFNNCKCPIIKNEQFENNLRMIDFKMLPIDYKNQIINSYLSN